jgi:hypothetical protein
MHHNSIKRVNRYFTWKSVAASCHHLYESIILANHKQTSPSKLISIDNLAVNAGYLLDPFYLTHNVPAINE